MFRGLPSDGMKKSGKVHRFTAPMERMAGRFAWHYVEFPHDVPVLCGKRGEVRVKCVINGVPVDRALMPTKSGVHIIVLGGELRRKAGIKKPGDPVTIELWLDPEPDRIDIPEDLAETLDFMPEVKALWDKLLPGVKRNMCYWVRTGKTAPTRAKRIAELIRRIENGEFERGRKQSR